MPFRSEKQRRFLWAKHPDIAKRWAHKYPESNKDLPMYAADKQDENQPESKAAALLNLRQALVNNWEGQNKQNFAAILGQILKTADSKLEHIEMPASKRPTSAGETHFNSILKPEAEDEGSIGKERTAPSTENCGQNVENPLLHKLAVVLAPHIQQEIENRRAEEEARAANNVPQNVNLKQYPVVNNMVPPPMGMTAPPAQPQAPQQAQQPAQAQLAAVGGGNSPNANPINSFGGLSTNGDINGNAAFGTQNAMGGEKMAAKKCSCGCGDTTVTCKCPPKCSCRQKGGSCYGLKVKQASGNNEILAKITGISSTVYSDPADIMELDDEMYSKHPEKLAAIGLWDRIRAKKQRGEKPAKPGDKDYPDSKSWNKVTAISEKKADNSLYTPAADVLNAALKNFRASSPVDFDGKPFDATDIQHYFDEAVSHAGGRDVELSVIGRKKLNPAMPYVLDSVYRAGQSTGDQSWLTNPRLWAGVGIGAGGVLGAYGLKKLYDRYRRPKQEKQSGSPAWQRSEGKNEEGGLNEKGRKSYERETGGNLKAPVTESNPSGERAKRQNSFCSRMCGMKRVNTGASTAKDPDSRINKSLRKWNCKCGNAMEFGIKMGQLLHWA